jgi:hypothetical protein
MANNPPSAPPAMNFEAAATSIVAILLASWGYTQWLGPFLRGNPNRLPLPPGPQPRFIVGNLQDLPSGGREWDSYAALAQKFSAYPSGVDFRFWHFNIYHPLRERRYLPACVRNLDFIHQLFSCCQRIA